jgi:hypothetical protein
MPPGQPRVTVLYQRAGECAGGTGGKGRSDGVKRERAVIGSFLETIILSQAKGYYH